MEVFIENLELLGTGGQNQTAIMQLLRLEAETYVQCMHPDRLLPTALLPKYG
jgi:hypothetical protein